MTLPEGTAGQGQRCETVEKVCRRDDCLSWSRGGVIGDEGREVGTMLQSLGGLFGESGMVPAVQGPGVSDRCLGGTGHGGCLHSPTERHQDHCHEPWRL